MLRGALVDSILWLAAAGAALSSLLLWAGPRKATPVSVLLLVATLLAVNGAVAIRSVEMRWLWHASRLFGALAGTALGVRYAMDAFWLPANDVVRSTNMGQALVTLLFAAGLWGSWQTGSIRAGALVAMAASVIGATISVAVYVPLFFTTIIHNDPDPGEAFVVVRRNRRGLWTDVSSRFRHLPV